MEHRWGRRVSVNIFVRLSYSDGDTADGRIVNVSRSGAFIRVRHAVSPLARVDVNFNGHTMESYVSRVEDDAFAVEWCEPLPNSLNRERHTLAEIPTKSEPASNPGCLGPVRLPLLTASKMDT